MTGIWLNLSGKIDPSTLRLLDQLGVILRANDAPFAIIGATARDLIFQFGFDIPVTRSTADVDCAVLLPDWTKFDQIKTALIATGNFRAGKNPQRVHWVETIPVDLVPFGEIAGTGNKLEWPPDAEIKMTTLGLREAHETARVIRLWIDPELDVRVATVPMLTVLKLIAWNDDPNVRRKDALDIAFMLKRYLDAGNEKRIFDDHLDLVTDDFDHEVASARLLGRDALTMMEAETCEAVLDILKRELLAPERSRLIVHMTDGGRRLAFERGVQMLEAFRQGLVDRAGVRR